MFPNMSAYDESYECLVDAVTVGDGLLGSAAPRIKTTDFQDLRFRELGKLGKLGKHLAASDAGVMRQGVAAPLPPSFVSERAR